MCWQVDGEDIDVEAQMRELERLEQARRDKLMAEELQHDMAMAEGQQQESSESVTDPTEVPPPPSHPEALEPPRGCWEENTATEQEPLRFKVADITHSTPGPSSFSPPDTTASLPSSVQTDGPVSHHTFMDLDLRLAEQLQEEERRERQKRESQSDRDAELARTLQQEEEKRRGGEEEMEGVVQSLQDDSAELSNIDEQVAHALQQEENEQEGGEDVLLAQRLQEEESELLKRAEHDEQLAHALQSEPQEDTSRDEELARQIAAQFEAEPVNSTVTPSGTSSDQNQGLLARPPNWWTVCPNCPPDSNRRFHLIEIAQGENEWLSITSPLQEAGFVPRRLLRVQNLKLYQRLQFEKQTMTMDRTEETSYSVNEKLLYHTSSASVPAICGEGLDQRLSRKGRFGNGVYFRFVYVQLLASNLQ